MINIKVGESERSFTDAHHIDESWINQQISRRREEGQSVCVRVFIKDSHIDVALSTPTCAGAGGGGRQPTSQELQVFELWEHLGLKKPDFQGGNVIAFLKQLRKILG